MRLLSNSFVLVPAGAAMLGSGAASAQNLTYDLTAQVGQVCGVYNAEGQTIDVDFGALANTPADQFIWRSAGDVTYRCNIQAGFTRTLASQNGGFLTLGGNTTSDAARRIEFTMQHWGADGFNYQQLTTPRITTHRDTAGNPRYLQGENARVWFRAYGVRAPAAGGAPTGSRVFAGDYRDTVTITIMAN
jgi:spore coat protein U-like protein